MVEATSGNTGIALALWAGVLGLRARIYIPRDMSSERKTMMKLLGADVVEIQYFVAGIGTGGTLTGMKLFLPDVKAVAVFPAERNHDIQGIGDGIAGSLRRRRPVDG